MGDIIFVAIILAFFTLCVLYVNWCDRIIGADENVSSTTTNPVDDNSPDTTASNPQEITS